MGLDDIDLRIIHELQQDARITNQELAERVSLSPSPCLRRVRKLEETGVIARYAAVVDQAKVGYPISAFVRITVERHAEDTMAEVEQRILELDDVVEAYLVAGEQDYLLRVVAHSFEAYEEFLRTRLRTIPRLASAQTTFAYRAFKSLSPLPLENARIC